MSSLKTTLFCHLQWMKYLIVFFEQMTKSKKGRSMTLSGSVLQENILQLADNTLLNLKQNDDSFNKDVLYFGSDMIIWFIKNRKMKLKSSQMNWTTILQSTSTKILHMSYSKTYHMNKIYGFLLFTFWDVW